MSWINEAAIKRRSQFSTVTIFETVDPLRVDQFLHFLREGDYHRAFNIPENGVEMLLYDPWEGLKDIRTGKQMKTDGESPLAAMLGSGGMDLGSALRLADAKLKGGTAVLVLRNIARREEILLQALRSWTNDEQLFAEKSSVFIFAEDSSTILDDYTKRKVAIIAIPLSSKEERTQIIGKLASDLEDEISLTTVDESMLVQASAGLTLHDTESALMESFFKRRTFDVEQIAGFKTEIVAKSGILTLEEPSIGFDAIGGYQSTKDFITREIINVLSEPERAEKMGLRPPRGVLLFGPPGTGKTLFGKGLAKQLRMPFVNLRLEDVMRGIVGQSEQRLRSAIDLIEELAPCLVFVDEIDRLGHRTDVSTDSGVSRRIFSMILEWLGDKNRKAILVGTTNEPEYLDHALMRAGRLDRKIPLLLPDVEARREIFRVHVTVHRQVPLADDVDFEALAGKTEHFSGAEIEELVLRAARAAFNEKAVVAQMRHFTEALESFNCDMDARRKQTAHYLELAERYCDDKTFLQQLTAQSGLDRVTALKREIT